VQRVLTGSVAGTEHRAGESAVGCHPHDRWLLPADVPRRQTVPVRGIPGLSGFAFVAGRLPCTEPLRSLRHAGPFRAELAIILRLALDPADGGQFVLDVLAIP